MSVYGVVGGIIGAIITESPQGFQYGYMIGAGIGAIADPQKIQGPKLDDLRVQISSYGVPIPQTWGNDRVAGNVIWSTDLVDTEYTDSGKGGPEVANHSYSVSCAILIGEGEIASIRRIWADAKCVYDVRPGVSAEVTAASDAFRYFFTFYTGSEAQSPDPTMEAHLGAGNVPAYLGSSYIVFTDLVVDEYGKRLPSFSFEIAVTAPETQFDPAGSTVLAPLKIYPWVFNEDSMPVHAIGSDATAGPDDEPGDDNYYTPLSDPSGGNGTDFSAVAVAQANAFVIDGANYAPTAATAAYNYSGYFYSHLNRRYLNDLSLLTGDHDPQYVSVLHSLYNLATSPTPYAAPAVPVPKAAGLTSPAFFGELTMAWPYYDGGNPGSWSAPFMWWQSGNFTPYLERGWWAPRTGQSPTPYSQIVLPGGYLVTSWINYALDLKSERLPTHAGLTGYSVNDQRGEQLQAVLGAAAAPNATGWCVLLDGSLVPNRIWTIVTGTAKQLAAVEYRAGDLYQNGLGPVLLPGDPDYSNASYWSAARTAAIAAGTMEADVSYPVVVGSYAQSTGSLAVTTQVDAAGDSTVTLAVIVSDICGQVSLTAGQIDVTEIAAIDVTGYTRTGRMPARAALESVCAAFHVFAVESDGKIAFRKFDRASVATITSDDLGAGVDQADDVVMTHERGQESELPLALTVNYRSLERDYQVGSQRVSRASVETDQQATVSVPVVMTDDQAKQLAEVLLDRAWVERNKRAISTTLAWAHIEPGDVIVVDDDDL